MSDIVLGQQSAIPGENDFAAYPSGDSPAWCVVERVRFDLREAESIGSPHNRGAHWMLGAPFGDRRSLQYRLLRDTVYRANEAYLRRPHGECARLVKGDRVDRPQRLEVASTFDDRARASCAPDRTEHGEGRSGRDPAGAGNDDHGNCGAGISRDGERQRRARQGEIHEIARVPIGGLLHRRARSLRALDSLDDLPEARVAREALSEDLECARLVDRTREYRRPQRLLYRRRLPSNRGLIHERVAPGHRTVHGDSLPWRDEDRVADVHLAEWDLPRPARPPRCCGEREEIE